MGVPGSSYGQLSGPTDIVLGSNGNFYVLDSGNSLIHEFTPAGKCVNQFGGSGYDNGQFAWPGPSGITIGANGHLYVVGKGNNRVLEFSQSGDYVDQWGSAGYGSGQFNGPYGITADDNGFIYVSDTGNNRIQKFSSVIITGSIAVNSYPTGARIFLNGVDQGSVTPHAINNIIPGKH